MLLFNCGSNLFKQNLKVIPFKCATYSELIYPRFKITVWQISYVVWHSINGILQKSPNLSRTALSIDYFVTKQLAILRPPRLCIYFNYMRLTWIWNDYHVHTISILGHQYGNGKIRQKYIHQKNDPLGGVLYPRHVENFLLRSMKQTRYTMQISGPHYEKHKIRENFYHRKKPPPQGDPWTQKC